MTTTLVDRPIERVSALQHQVTPSWRDGEWFSLGPAVRRHPLSMRLYMIAADPSRFAAWLKSLPPGTMVGTPSEENDCPLKRWLRAEAIFEGRRFAVWPDTVQVQRWRLVPLRSASLALILPRWAQQFISFVDDRNQDCILRHEALRDLARAEQRAHRLYGHRGMGRSYAV